MPFKILYYSRYFVRYLFLRALKRVKLMYILILFKKITCFLYLYCFAPSLFPYTCTRTHTSAFQSSSCTVVEGVLGGLRLRQHVLVNRTWMLDCDESIGLLYWHDSWVSSISMHAGLMGLGLSRLVSGDVH